MKQEELHRAMMFILWCNSMGYHPSLCESIENFNKYMHDANVHRGDCTKDPCPCIRCHTQQLEIEAQCAIDYLEHESNGTWFKLIELRDKVNKCQK